MGCLSINVSGRFVFVNFVVWVLDFFVDFFFVDWGCESFVGIFICVIRMVVYLGDCNRFFVKDYGMLIIYEVVEYFFYLGL